MTRFKLGYLLGTLLTLLLSIAFGLLIIITTNQYNNALKDYDSYLRRSYTYVNSNKIRQYKSGTIYEIYVMEETDPLIVYNITSPAVDNKLLSSLYEGEVITVYINTERQIDNYSYEVVEIKSEDKTILSLEDHQKKGRNNSIMGFILVPILSLTSLGVSIYLLLKFLKAPTQ